MSKNFLSLYEGCSDSSTHSTIGSTHSTIGSTHSTISSTHSTITTSTESLHNEDKEDLTILIGKLNYMEPPSAGSSKNIP